MPKIFINYRRGDTAGHAGRLFDRLREDFGAANLFMDVTAIGPGLDFKEAIEQAVEACDVLMVVIGRDWLSCVDDRGRRRIDLADDFVRLEVSAALRRNVRVVPVLVERADLPKEADLPDDLKPLVRRQAFELRDARWDVDAKELSHAVGGTPMPAPANSSGWFKPRRITVLACLGAMSLGGIALAWLALDSRQGSQLPFSVTTTNPATNSPPPAPEGCRAAPGSLLLFTFADELASAWKPLAPAPVKVRIRTSPQGCADTSALELTVPRGAGDAGAGAFVDLAGLARSWSGRKALHVSVMLAPDMRVFSDLEVYVESDDYKCTCSWSRPVNEIPTGEWYDLALPLKDCAKDDEASCRFDADNVVRAAIKLYETSATATLRVDGLWLE